MTDILRKKRRKIGDPPDEDKAKTVLFVLERTLAQRKSDRDWYYRMAAEQLYTVMCIEWNRGFRAGKADKSRC